MKERNLGPRTSIKDIPVCNDKLYKEVGALMKVPPQEIREIADFIGSFITGIMRKGQMEGVMLPYFGKFRPKENMVRTSAKVRLNEQNGMDMLYRAVKGQRVVDLRTNPQNPPTDGSETI